MEYLYCHRNTVCTENAAFRDGAAFEAAELVQRFHGKTVTTL